MIVVLQLRPHDQLRSEPQSGVMPPRPSGSSSSTTLGKSAEEGARQGEVEARVDLAAGVLGWKESGGYGLPPPQTYEAVGMATSWSATSECGSRERRTRDA